MPQKHTVQQGETTISLSEQHGFFAGTIWDNSDNSTLRGQREDMNVLLPGDILTIPDLRQKTESKSTGQRHRFRRKGIPALFRLQVFDFETERANQKYTLTVDDETYSGTTDAHGILEHYVPAQARKGELLIGDDRFRVQIEFGVLDPLNELVGVQKRLNNIGYDCGEPDGEMNERTQRALVELQRRFALPLTGKVDDATRNKLREVHDKSYDFQPPKEEDSGDGK